MNHYLLRSKNKSFYILFLLTLLTQTKSFSSDYFWVGGAGNWSDYANHWATSSGGNNFHTQIPTPVDNVIFDNNSFINANDTVELDTTLIYLNNLIYDNALPALLYAPSQITIEVFESVNLDPGLKLEAMSSNMNLKGSGIYNFKTSQDTLNITINFMSAGDYALTDDLHTQSVYITNGKFRTNDHFVFANYRFQASLTPEIFLGTSEISAYTVFLFGIAAFSIDADSSTFHCADFTANKPWVFNDVYCTNKFQSDFSDYHDVEAIWFSGNNGNFHNVKINTSPISSSFYATQSNFNKIEINKGIYTGGGNFSSDTLIIHVGTEYSFKDSITINKLFLASGDCAHYSSLSGWDNSHKGHIVMSAGSYDLDYSNFSNITFSSGLTFTANNSFDLGSVTGISIANPSPKKLYWVGGSGNWIDETHWSRTSGAPSDNCLPTLLDTVVFDQNSFANYDTVTISSNPHCRTFIWNSDDTVLVKTSFTNELTIHQSFHIDNPTTILFNVGRLHFISDSPGNIVSTNNANINSSMDFTGTGEWSFNSDFTNLNEMIVHGGTIRTHGHKINCNLIDFDLQNNTAFYMDSSLIEGSWHYENQNPSMIISSVNTDFIRSNVISDIPIICRDYIDCGHVELAANSSFHDMEIKSVKLNPVCSGRNLTVTDYQRDISDVIINGANLNKLTIDTRACNLVGLNAHIDTVISVRPGLSLTSSEINADNYLKLNGSCDGNIMLTGSIHVFGNTDLKNIFFRDVTFSGNTPVASVNCVFDGTNQGITTNTTNPRTLYWVNGSGNWGDSNHWSLISGGTAGECIPTRFDDVVIDSLSLLSGNLEITLNYLLTECRSFTDKRQCEITDNNNTTFINIYGNFTTDSLFTARVNFDYPITLVCESGINSIDSKSYDLQRSIELKGQGSFEIVHELRCENKLTLRMKEFRSNGFPLTIADQILINNVDQMNIYMDTSTITCNGFAYFLIGSNASSVLDFDSCVINAHTVSGQNIGLNVVNAEYISCDSCSGNLFTALHFDLDTTYVKEIIGSAFQGGTCDLLNCNIQKLQLDNVTGRFSGTAQIDTLLFHSAGQDMLLDNLNISVTRHLEIISDAGFPSRLKTGIQNPCNIIYSGDTLCTDNVYFENIIVNGPTPWYVGSNSFDLGGNSGLNFIACPIINNINSFDFTTVSLFPNPVNSGFAISLNVAGHSELTFTLYDILGNIMVQRSLEKPLTEISRSGISSGVYFYQLKDHSDIVISSGKLIFN